MATTIKLKNSVTATNAPSSLAQGEVAINITDKKVWVGNAATTPIQLLGAGGSATFGALTCTSLTNSGLTSGRVTYASTGGLLADSANLTFNGTTLTANTIGAFTLGGTIAGGGNQINNVIIGASTPLAGSFTTLSASGVATFSAGTVSAPAITTTGDTNTGIFFPAADTIAFTEGGAEAMRIDSSGNVGIGTSSPGAKLSLTSTGNTTADGVRLTFGSEARPHNIYSDLSTGRDLLIAPWRAVTLKAGSGTTEGEVRLQSYESTIISTGSSYTERMRIDSSGNLLVGTTTAVEVLTVSGQFSLRNSQGIAVSKTGSTANVLNNGTLTLTGLSQSGLLVINNNVDQIALYLCTATATPSTTEISDPSGVYSTASGTASNTNVYFSGGVLTLENKTGSTRSYRISYLTN